MVAGPARFTPGGSTAVVAPWFAALVDASVGSPLVRSLAALVEEPEGTIDDLVETLTTYRLRDLPAFRDRVEVGNGDGGADPRGGDRDDRRCRSDRRHRDAYLARAFGAGVP